MPTYKCMEVTAHQRMALALLAKTYGKEPDTAYMDFGYGDLIAEFNDIKVCIEKNGHVHYLKKE